MRLTVNFGNSIGHGKYLNLDKAHCTKEAKVLGIKRGTPFFQTEELCAKNHVAIFSNNYELYGDLSGRMMAPIASFVDKIEPYSIDECFANMSGFDELDIDITDLGRQI